MRRVLTSSPQWRELSSNVVCCVTFGSVAEAHSRLTTLTDFWLSAPFHMTFPDSMLWMGLRAFADEPLPGMCISCGETACVRLHVVL